MEGELRSEEHSWNPPANADGPLSLLLLYHFQVFFFILLLMAVIIKNVFCGCGYFLNIFLLKYILIIFFYFLKIIFNNNILK